MSQKRCERSDRRCDAGRAPPACRGRDGRRRRGARQDHHCRTISPAPKRWLAARMVTAHRHGLRRPRLRRRRPGDARRRSRSRTIAGSPATATPTSCSTRSPTPCSARRRWATSATISRRPTRRWKGAASDRSLPMPRELVRRSRRDHRPCRRTVICEAPKIGPHRAAMRARVAEILAIPRTSGQHQGDDDRAARLHRPRRRHCRPGGGQHSAGDRSMSDQLLPPELVDKAREVVEANRAAGRRVAVAESCTGGLVSAALTEIPGSSDVFEAGYVTYSNAAKIGGLEGQRGRGRDVRRGQRRHRLGDGARRARSVGRRCRGGDHRHRRARRRHAVEAGRHGGLRARRARCRPRRRSSPTSKHFDAKGRSGVRLQAALCALELLMP